jgi:hypothetical protein
MPDGFPPLRPIGPDDEALVAAHLARAGETTCDLTLAGLLVWRDCEVPSYATVGGSLCIHLDPHHEPPYFLEPLGDGDPVASLAACVAKAGRASRVREALAARMPQDRFRVEPQRDHFDYICDVAGLAALRGRQHDGQRNRIRKFAKEHPRHELRALTAGDAAGATALFDRWSGARADPQPDAATSASPAAVRTDACQRRALERAFEGFERLGLLGGALVVDGALRGFLLASRAGDTAIAHFLYADAELPGVYQMLVNGCCREFFAGLAYVNLEEDMGIAALRRTKLSWRPVRMLEKFTVTPRC